MTSIPIQFLIQQSVLSDVENYKKTGLIPDMRSYPDQYFVVAANQNLIALRNLAQNIMLQNISEENFQRYHKIARIFNSQKFKEKLIEFLMEPLRTKQILDSYFHKLEIFFDK